MSVFRTLPEVAVGMGVSVDGLRVLVRRTPELRAMGRKIGPTRYFTEAEADELRRAWENYRAARTTSASGANQ